jgi:hypothetical protein
LKPPLEYVPVAVLEKSAALTPPPLKKIAALALVK